MGSLDGSLWFAFLNDLLDEPDLGLPYPKMIDAAVPANMVCGLHEVLQSSRV